MKRNELSNEDSIDDPSTAVDISIPKKVNLMTLLILKIGSINANF
jgi:hypothetical protein